jgi:hypothetical protein
LKLDIDRETFLKMQRDELEMSLMSLREKVDSTRYNAMVKSFVELHEYQWDWIVEMRRYNKDKKLD